MNNQVLAGYLEEIADLLEIKGEQVYRILAYRRAAEGLLASPLQAEKVWQDRQLESIPGVGKAIAAKVSEILETGELVFLNQLREEVPTALREILQVADVGPKKAARFWKELGITSLDELESAAQQGKVKDLAGMGERSEKKLLDNIQALKTRETGRLLLGEAFSIAEKLLRALEDIPGVKAVELGGSLRRWKETIGDIDLLAAADDPEPVLRAFTELPSIAQVRGQGETKASVSLEGGTRVQLWVHPPGNFGTALQYATGSQAHNVRLRELALKQGFSLSEHSLTKEDGGELTFTSEEELYHFLGVSWIPPELREDRGEIQAALSNGLPELVETSNLRGELHSHTDWSDGKLSIEEMAQAAKARGAQYLAITDHSGSLGIANGLSVARLRKQRVAIEKARKNLGTRFKLFHGAEVEILANGELDYPDEVLAELDLVIASLHTSLRQPRAQVTDRMLGALRNPHVDILAHPTGRLLGLRDPADLDMEAVLKTAAEQNVILEINANPERLDLNDVHARRALELGCLLAINTDAHHPDHLAFQKFGTGVARRAWAQPDRIVNGWTASRLQKHLQKR